MALMLYRCLLRAAAPVQALRHMPQTTMLRPLPSLTALPGTMLVTRGVKTKSAIKKRFRVKPNGSIARLHSNKRHGMMSKSRNHVNRLGGMGVVAKAGIRKRYLKLLRVSPLKGR